VAEASSLVVTDHSLTSNFRAGKNNRGNSEQNSETFGISNRPDPEPRVLTDLPGPNRPWQGLCRTSGAKELNFKNAIH
jgi:hypothetical protein